MPASVAIIIPTRNEAADILPTLQSAIDQTVAPAEVIVVDDSEDATPEIVNELAKAEPSLVLLKGLGSGRTGARNQGMLYSTSDVVVLLNADVRLPKDFIERILPHYAAGAGYVLVGLRAANCEQVRARFVVAQSKEEYPSDEDIDWTEGFSCLRSLAIQSGMFPETLIPLVAGEDGLFGRRIGAIGRKVVDRSIEVSCVVPANSSEFHRTYQERAFPHYQFFILKRPIITIILRNAVRQAARMLSIVTIIPFCVRITRISHHSTRRKRDTFWFLLTGLEQQWAYSIGEWKGLFRLVRALQAKGLPLRKILSMRVQ